MREIEKWREGEGEKSETKIATPMRIEVYIGEMLECRKAYLKLDQTKLILYCRTQHTTRPREKLRA